MRSLLQGTSFCFLLSLLPNAALLSSAKESIIDARRYRTLLEVWARRDACD
jgi:hypothetical protein